MSSFSLRTRRPPDPLGAAARHRARRPAAKAIAAALIAVALTAFLAARPGRFAAQTALVIDEVVVYTGPDLKRPPSVCVVSLDGSTNGQVAERVELRWSPDQYWVSAGRMRLKPIALGELVTVYIGQDCTAEDLVQKGGDSFAAGTGFTRLRRNSFDYVVSYHME